MAVIVTNIYLRRNNGKRVPFILRKVFISSKALPPRGDSTRMRQFSTSAADARNSLAAENHVINDHSNNQNNKNHTYPAHASHQQSRPHVTSLSPSHLRHHHHHSSNTMMDTDVDRTSVSSDMESSFCMTCTTACSRRRTRRQQKRFRHRQCGSASSDDDDSEMRFISFEWKVLAKKVDTLCFWIFLISSCMVLTILFSRIPF